MLIERIDDAPKRPKQSRAPAGAVTPAPCLTVDRAAWSQGDPSPSRLDALVWAVTDLMLARSETTVVVGTDRGKGLTGDLMGYDW